MYCHEIPLNPSGAELEANVRTSCDLVANMTLINHGDKLTSRILYPHFQESRKKSGVQCPTCARFGDTVWVTPGKNCYICGTPCEK
ncbi:hypothetical protein HI914_00382 [Erysiphe necator]|nr:hypothetical protein HI914_00382 [Erysiphe necator]